MADSAKQQKARIQPKEVYQYPSRFGSHKTMVDETATKKLKDSSFVVCKDEFGLYTTQVERLDSGLADPNRYSNRV